MAGFPLSILDPAESSDTSSGVSALLDALGIGGEALGGIGLAGLGPLFSLFTSLFGGGVPTTAKTSAVAGDLSKSSNPDDQLLGQFMDSQGINDNNVLSNPAFASKTNRMADIIEALTGQTLPNWQAKGSTGEITGFTGPGFSTPANIMGVESGPQAAGTNFGTPGASPKLTAAQISAIMPQLQKIAAGTAPITASELDPLVATADTTPTGVGSTSDYLNQGGGSSSGESSSNPSTSLSSLLNLLPVLNLFGLGGSSSSSESTSNNPLSLSITPPTGAGLYAPKPTAAKFAPWVPQALPTA